MEESRHGWRRGGKGRSPVATSGKGWQSRKQPAAKTGTSRHRVRLVTLGLTTVSLLAGFIIIVLIIPRDMPLVVLGVVSYEAPIPPNSYVSEDAARLAGTNTWNIKHIPVTSDRITREALKGYLKDNLDPGAGFVSKELVTIYLSAHGVVDSQGQACLLLSDSKPLDETTWMPVSELLQVLSEERPDTVKVLLLDSGKIDANWSLGILHNAFPDRVEEAVQHHSKIFVMTDRASGQLAWSAPERGGTIFGHFVASGLSEAADADGRNGVSLLEFYDFVRSKVDGWVSDNRSSRQTPQLMPLPTQEQNIKLVSSGAGPSENGSAKELLSKLSSVWQSDLLPLWTRYEEFVGAVELRRYDPLGLATIEAELLRAEQLLLAGGAYKIEFAETIKNISALMSDAAKPSLPDALRGFSLPLAGQLDRHFDPATSGQEVMDAWLKAGGWPKNEEGKEKPFSLSYLESANVAQRWLLESASEPGGAQLRDAIRLVETSRPYVDDQGIPIEHVQEVQLLKLVSQYADATDAEHWPSTLRAALRQAMLAQKTAEQIAAPADERTHYWVQLMLNAVDQRRRTALDQIFIGDDASLTAARDEFSKSLTVEGAAAGQRVKDVTAAYQLRDRVLARLPHLAFWFSLEGRLDEMQPDLNAALQSASELSDLLDADDTTTSLDFTDQHRSVVDRLRAASDKLESELGQHVANQLRATPASGTLLRTHHILRTPLTTSARDRQDLFLRRYMASMELEHEAHEVGDKPPSTDPPTLTHWPTHPAVLLAGHDKLAAPSKVDAAREDAVTWLNLQGRYVREALRDISKKKARLEQETEDLLRSERADATARRTRLGLAKADDMARSAAALLGERPWNIAADPTRRLRYVDRHFQLLWHADRVLEDFWGPTKSQRALPYFANVADVYLKGAKTLAPASSVLGYADEADLKKLRDRRVAATEIAIAAGAEVKCYEPEETREYQFRIACKPDLPQGQAAVFITERVDNDPARLFTVLAGAAQVRRRGQEIHQADSIVEQDLQLVKPVDRTELPLAARVLFRGHEQAQRFTAQWPKQIIPVRAEYAHPVQAKVTVEGDTQRIGYIMFIVDCSLSMNESGRMGRAISALGRVLDDLGSQPNYAIGLRAYGRKAGFIPPAGGRSDYEKDENGNYLVRRRDQDGKYDTVSADDPLELHPDLDADDLIEPMALRKSQADAIRQHIKDLRPNGVTPLYLALKNSLLKDFAGRNASRDEGSTRHIVLITDGDDFFSQRSALGQKPTRTVAAEVAAAWNQSGSDVQIHIIFMDPPAQIATELKEIPQKTGGIYKGANEAAALVQGIREAIGLVEFSVDQPASSNSDTPNYRLGDTATVTELRRDSQVRIYGAPSASRPTRHIYLDGGEAIKLIYEHPLNRVPRLVFPIEDPLAAYGNARRVSDRKRVEDRHDFIVRAFRPEMKGADVDFYVTVQDVTNTQERDNRTEHFTPPVRQVWCEITPVIGAARFAEQRYYFFDVDSELDQPIPKLRFQAKAWPRAATKAEMKVWFSFDPFRRTARERQGVEIDASGTSRTFSVPGPDGAKIEFHASAQKLSEAEPYRLTIRETNTSLGAAAIFVSPTPDAISHVFYSFGASGDVVNHVYEFKEPGTTSVDVRLSSQFKEDPSVISVPQLDVLVEE